MRVALIKPKVTGTRPYIEKAIHMIGGTLPVLAAYTPRGVSLDVYDESLGKLDVEKHYDLVGISVMTPAAPRAYELAAHYRSRGTKVVLGGAHITALPEEALQYADAISIFNGEKTWPKIIEDAWQDRLQRVYRADFEEGSPSRLPVYSQETANFQRKFPRRDILQPEPSSKKIVVESVATSVGCIYTCNFCMIPVMYGRKHIASPIDFVLEDIKMVSGKRIYLNDDNFMGNPKVAEELFRRMIELQEEKEFEWFSQSTIVLGKRPRLAKIARESGCKGIYIGFESVNEGSVRENVGKGCNRVQDYVDAVQVLHDNGIRVEGGFVFGFDNDDKGTFERTLEFAEKMKLDSINPHILTPHPGTRVYQDLMKEGRIFAHGNWEKFYTGEAVFEPKLMSAAQLQEGYNWFCKEAFSLDKMVRRSMRGIRKSPQSSLETLMMNIIGKPKVG